MTSIFYLSRADLSVQRAHIHNIAKTCEALAKIEGIKVFLVSTSCALAKNEISCFLKEHSIKRRFALVFLNSWGNFLKGNKFRLFNWLETILANFTLVFFLIGQRKKIDVVYLRDQHLFLAAIFGKYFLSKPVFFEVHAGQRKAHTQILLDLMVRMAKGVIAISWALKDYYTKLNKNIIVSFCFAPEQDNFSYQKNKKTLRKELALPQDRVILGYTGRLDFGGIHSNYEIDKVIKALKFLPRNVLFSVIGARENEAEKLAKMAKDFGVETKLMILPRLPRLAMPSYLSAFDILILPKLGDRPGDSPAKMFEYLAAKKPIVAAKTGPVSEVLSTDENALLVSSNTSEEWTKAIKRLLGDKKLQKKLSETAFEDSKKYTWQKRAEAISGFILNNL